MIYHNDINPYTILYDTRLLIQQFIIMLVTLIQTLLECSDYMKVWLALIKVLDNLFALYSNNISFPTNLGCNKILLVFRQNSTKYFLNKKRAILYG